VERPQAARRRRLAGARALDLDNLGEAVVAEGAAVPSRAAQDVFWELVKIEAWVRSAVLAARIARRKVVAVKFDDVVGVARVLLGPPSLDSSSSDSSSPYLSVSSTLKFSPLLNAAPLVRMPPFDLVSPSCVSVSSSLESMSSMLTDSCPHSVYSDCGEPVADKRAAIWFKVSSSLESPLQGTASSSEEVWRERFLQDSLNNEVVGG